MRSSVVHVTLLYALFLLVNPKNHVVYSQQNPGHSFDISNENGVLIAENSGGPKYTDQLFVFEKMLELRPDSENQASYLYLPSDFAQGEDGYYFVADNGNQRIAVFTPDGDYERSFGREGSGPGEFQNLKMEILYEGLLQMFDQNLRRITRFRTDGTLLDVLSVREGGETLMDAYYCSDNKILVVSQERERSRQFEDTKAVVSIRDLDQVELYSLESSPARQIAISGRRRSAMYFAPMPQVKVNPGLGCMISTGGEPVIDWYNWSGEHVRHVNLNLTMQPVTREDRANVQALIAERLADAPAEVRERQLGQEQIFPDSKAHWHSSRVDDSGYMWLIKLWDFQAREDGLGTTCHVVSPEGEYMGICYLPSSTGRFCRGKYLAIITDEDTGERVPTVFRIRAAIDGLPYPN